MVEQFPRVHRQNQGVREFQPDEVIILAPEHRKGEDGIGVVRRTGVQRSEKVGVICAQNLGEVTQANCREPWWEAQQSSRRVEVVRLLDESSKKSVRLVEGWSDRRLGRVFEKKIRPLRRMVLPLF